MSQVIQYHTMTLVHRDFGQHLRCTLFNKDCCCTPFTRIGIVVAIYGDCFSALDDDCCYML